MKGLLSRIEILIALVFILVFLMWAGSRCKETKVSLQEEAIAEAVEDSLATANKTPQKKPSNNTLEEALRKKKDEIAARSKTGTPGNSTSTAPAAATASTSPAGKLYITIDKLKLRSAPGLESKILGELSLFSEVYFMEEVTDSIYTLSLGKDVASEPYVKVKTKRGTVGWVYGAGVNYYKKKREGVLE